jgi:DNA-binding MarR family transcriptional regulator
MWYFLRVLWNEDGLTQRELSRRLGLMEPTTLTAILSMEKRGLIRRVRNKTDRRRMHVYLTPKGKTLKLSLMPLARSVVATATEGFSSLETKRLLSALAEVQENIHGALSQFDEIDVSIID